MGNWNLEFWIKQKIPVFAQEYADRLLRNTTPWQATVGKREMNSGAAPVPECETTALFFCLTW